MKLKERQAEKTKMLRLSKARLNNKLCKRVEFWHQ